MQRLTGVTQNYAWGTTDGIPGLLGTTATDEPVAEYWLGAHPSAPSELPDGSNLYDQVCRLPETLGDSSRAAFGDRLPFLFKLLSAQSPLSLQAHPTRAEAAAGFAAEEAASVPITAAERTYKDDWPKPELMIALEPFEALCGFRDPKQTYMLFQQLGMTDELAAIVNPLTTRTGEAAIAETFLDALGMDESRKSVVDHVVAAAMNHVDDPGEIGQFARTAVELDAEHPSDPSIIAALLTNRVHLEPGQAIFLPAGNLHAYLRGTGVEVMANSDNVIRGGLTKKHIDVDELVRVVSFVPGEIPVIEPVEVSEGVALYPTPAPEFDTWVINGTGDAEMTMPASDVARILMVTSGSLHDRHDNVYRQGESAFIAAGEVVVLAGSGTAYLAGAGV